METIFNKLSSDYSIDKIISWITNNKFKTVGIFTLTSLIMRHLSIRIYRKIKRYPPGPIGLPVVGILPYLIFYHIFQMPLDENGEKKDFFAIMHHHAKYYGAIYYVSWPGFLSNHVSINNSKLLRKIMNDRTIKDVTSHRYGGGMAPFFTAKDGNEGFANINGKEWSQRRKLFLSVFNKMLTTKFMNKVSGTSIKNVLIPEINKICIEQNKSFNIRTIVKDTSFQTLFYACFDRFCDPNDEFLRKFKIEIETTTELQFTQEGLKTWGVPKDEWRVKFPGLMEKRDRLCDLTQQLMDQRRAELKEKGINYHNPSSELKMYGETVNDDLSAIITDLEFDSYLDYLLKLVDQGAIKNSTAQVECMALFSAGYHNNSLLMEFMMVYLAKYPKIQQEIRRELYAAQNINIQEQKDDDNDNVIDFNLGNVNKCPLFRAFLYETLRVSSFARAGALRKITRDIEIEWEGNKYILYKEMTLGYQIETIMIKDTNQNEGWIVKDGGKIRDFNIDNFLDKNKKFRLNESMSSFGFGSRDCPGKAFAVKSIQIVVGYILMNYKIEFGQEEKRNDPENAKIKADLSKFIRIITPEIPLKFSRI